MQSQDLVIRNLDILTGLNGGQNSGNAIQNGDGGNDQDQCTEGGELCLHGMIGVCKFLYA